MVPKYDAPDSEIDKMIDEMRELLKFGYSVAANTQGLVDKNMKESIQERGKMMMKTKQWEVYEAWKNGMLILPSWDWSKTETVEQGCVKSWTVKMEALCRMYKKKSISAEQAKAWVKHNTELHTLMGGVAAMVRAERAFCGGKNNKDLNVVAEQVVCRKIGEILRNRHSARVPTDITTIKKINTFKDELRERSLSLTDRV